jgi:UDP-2,3-diacylglucosamine hydrolase
VSDYLFSDVHLRPDRPERAGRLARWVETLEPRDSLIALGDLCDFWMASRLPEDRMLQCPGLRALADFRARGGRLQIMPGNHDRWLCPFYARGLGAEIVEEPLDLTLHGLRVHLVHGHLLGARARWKAWMESRHFHRGFGRLPGPLAGLLDRMLERKNQRNLLEDEKRHLRIYREYAAGRRGLCDLVVIGHVHRAVDEPDADPRLIVLGGWQRRWSVLRIDGRGACFQISPDAPDPETFAAGADLPASTDSRL